MSISSSFLWSDTEQGHEYWWNLSRKISNGDSLVEIEIPKITRVCKVNVNREHLLIEIAKFEKFPEFNAKPVILALWKSWLLFN